MEFYKIVIIVLVTLILAMILKGINSELELFPVLLITMFILSVAIEQLGYLYTELTSTMIGDFAKNGFSYLLKVTGICLVTDFISETAKDMNYSAFSSAISLFGRICMITCITPLVFEIVDF